MILVRLVEFLEDRQSKLLDASYDIPTLVVLYLFVDKPHNPIEKGVFFVLDIGDDVVNSLVFHFAVVEPNIEVGGQSELASQVAEHALEEAVDGFHSKIMVVVN